MAGALEGIRVLDLSRYVAGPYCGMMLGDMGASVVKVEKPGVGEALRQFGRQVEGESLYAMAYNRNKYSLSLDLASADGQALLRALAAEADILLENFRPGVLEALGCAPETLLATNPRLIVCRISGFGQTGPYANRPCFDVIVQAMSGIMELTGDADGPPRMAGTVVCDFTAGMHATIGILAALQARHRTGRGQVVDVSLLDTASSMLATAIPERMLFGDSMTRCGNRDRYSAPTNSFRSRDGHWFHLVAGNDEMFTRFGKAIGQPDLIRDPRFASMPLRLDHVEAVEAIVEAWAAETDLERIQAMMDEAGVPCAKIATFDDVVDNPQLRHRGTLTEIEHPVAGRIPMQGLPIRLSDTPAEIRCPLPGVGQHTDEVLRDWLGYDDGRIAGLRRTGTV